MSHFMEQSPLVKTSAEICYDYDYVLVFPVEKEGRPTAATEQAIKAIHGCGLETFSYMSVQNDELIVLVRCPLAKLRAYADGINYRLLLDKTVARELCAQGDALAGIAPIHIADSAEYSSLDPYAYLYGKYEQDLPESLYWRPIADTAADSAAGPFRESVRLKLVHYLLQGNKQSGGCGLKIDKMLQKKQLLAIYPMHQPQQVRALLLLWAKHSWPWSQPLDMVKEYFGEKIGLYFSFMGTYTSMLLLPAIVGLAVQLVVWGTQNFSHPVLPFFSVCISLWAVIFLEVWKREEKMTALRWGTCDFEDEEPERPDFKGELIKSFIDGSDMIYFPPSQQRNLITQSAVLIISLIMLVIGTVASIYVLRFQLYQDIGSSASIVASALNSLQITVFNMVYGYVARKLTNRENHRTITQYEDSMIAKLFVFQFVNSYTSFYYLAFIAPYLPRPDFLSDTGREGSFVGDCGFSDCMIPLQINLAIIFGMNLTVNNIIELAIPLILHKRKMESETKGATETMTLPEAEYVLQPYDVMTANMKDYAEVAVQFGYMSIFIVALPIACLVSFINNIVEIKVDAWKLLKFHQRPIPKTAADIGNWQNVFRTISVIAVATNAGLVFFTMKTMKDFSLSTRIWLFIGYIGFLLLAQNFIADVIPDEPPEYVIQRQRSQFILSKLIDKVSDENDEEMLAEGVANAPHTGASCITIEKYPRDAIQRKTIEMRHMKATGADDIVLGGVQAKQDNVAL